MTIFPVVLTVHKNGIQLTLEYCIDSIYKNKHFSNNIRPENSIAQQQLIIRLV